MFVVDRIVITRDVKAGRLNLAEDCFAIGHRLPHVHTIDVHAAQEPAEVIPLCDRR